MRKSPRILIVKLSSLGDLFHALPTVRALKKELNAKIDWVTQPEYESLVGFFDDVDRVICFPRHNLCKQFNPFLKQLRTTHYDYVIDLQGLMKSALVVAAACGKRKLGPSGAREGAQLFYHALAGKKDKERHAAEELLDVVRHLCLPSPKALEFPISFPSNAPLDDGPHIALCPRSRAAGKDWPADRFVKVAQALRESRNATIHLVGGLTDQTLCETMAEEIGTDAINHAGKTTLIELGSLLKQMNLVITVDSGPMHMAAAIGTPTLALFGPTSPKRTGPYGSQHRVIESTFNAGGKKISKKTRQRDMRYIEAIPVEKVISTAKEMIAT